MTPDTRILTAFRSAGERSLSTEEIARQAGISVSAVQRRVEALRALGYEIESSPHRGYRFVRGPDLLHAEDLHAQLGRKTGIGRDIRVFEETTSTNDVVDRLARDGVREGVVVFAESQTRGRGRLGRNWMSPSRKGLWFSVLLRPNLPLESVTQITIAAATALARAIRTQAHVRPDIKWPNDIVIGGKKIAGVLTELTAEVDTVKFVILGIGVDVNLVPSDFPPELHGVATSLRIEAGHPIDRAALAAAILRELDIDYRRVTHGRFEEVADEWEAQCVTIGHQVVVQMGNRKVRGQAESLDSVGALLLRTHHGHLERISGGDVTLER